MHKYLLFFILIPIFTASWGQMNMKQGDWSLPKYKGTHQGFVMADSNHVFSIDFQKNVFRNEQKLIANVYDKKTLNILNSFEIVPEVQEGIELDLVQLFSLEGSMVLVMVEKNKEKPREKRILLQLINANGQRNKTIVADTLPTHQNVNEDFQIIVDKNESAFIICTNYPVSLEENQKLKITAFNSNLTQKWNKTVEFPDKEKQYIFTDWRYDGGSKVFFLSRHIIDMYQVDMEFTRLTQNTYYLWGYDYSRDKLNEIELSLNQRFIHKITIEQDRNRYIVGGVFADDKNFKTDGVFNIILDSNWHVKSHLIHNFDKLENKVLSSSIQDKKSQKGINEIQIKGIETFKNGEFAIVGEEFYKEIEEPNDGRMTTSNYTEIYYFQNISVFWFEANGNLKGVFSIPKNQISVNDNGVFSSYSLASSGQNLYFFYNDHPKNLSVNNPNGVNNKPISGFRNIYLNAIQLSEKGIVRRKAVTSASRKAKIRPVLGSQLLDGNAYFLIQKRRKNAIIQVQFP